MRYPTKARRPATASQGVMRLMARQSFLPMKTPFNELERSLAVASRLDKLAKIRYLRRSRMVREKHTVERRRRMKIISVIRQERFEDVSRPHIVVETTIRDDGDLFEIDFGEYCRAIASTVPF